MTLILSLFITSKRNYSENSHRVGQFNFLPSFPLLPLINIFNAIYYIRS